MPRLDARHAPNSFGHVPNKIGSRDTLTVATLMICQMGMLG